MGKKWKNKGMIIEGHKGLYPKSVSKRKAWPEGWLYLGIPMWRPRWTWAGLCPS